MEWVLLIICSRIASLASANTIAGFSALRPKADMPIMDLSVEKHWQFVMPEESMMRLVHSAAALAGSDALPLRIEHAKRDPSA